MCIMIFHQNYWNKNFHLTKLIIKTILFAKYNSKHSIHLIKINLIVKIIN